MSLSEHFWIVVIAYLVFSVYGLKCIRDYTLRCLQSGYIPFNGSVFKVVFFSFICGFFTTGILIFTVVESLWYAFGDFWKKMRKK